MLLSTRDYSVQEKTPSAMFTMNCVSHSGVNVFKLEDESS